MCVYSFFLYSYTSSFEPVRETTGTEKDRERKRQSERKKETWKERKNKRKKGRKEKRKKDKRARGQKEPWDFLFTAGLL